MTRRLLRVAIAAVLALGGLVAVGSAAQAAGYEGYCTDDQGVTVVVDFQGLGGGIVIRCAPAPLPGSGTGLDALNGAGVPIEGVRRWGDAFICRIYGKPAVTQDLPVTGNPSYREQCIDTPPAAAYWSYWSAPNGGAWTYGSYGVKNRRAIAGGFEGWSFSLNATTASSAAPGVAPRRPAASPPAPPPSPTSTGAAGANPVVPGAPGGSGSAVSGSGSGSAAPPRVPAGGGVGRAGGVGGAGGVTSLPPSLAATDPPAGSMASVGASAPGSSTSPLSATSSLSAPPSVSPMSGTAGALSGTAGALSGSSGATTDGSSRVVGSDQVLAESAPSGGGTPVATILGLGVLAFLVTAGAGTAWRRRHR